MGWGAGGGEPGPGNGDSWVGVRWTWVALVSVVVLVGGCTADPQAVKPGPTVAQPVPGPVAGGSAVGVAPLAMPRAAHTATPLRDGRVLVVGGCTRPGCGGTPDGGRAELYEPATRRFVPGPTMVRARAGHTATALPDGRVLIVGGYPDEGRPPLRDAEIYDPGTGAFTQTGALATARGAHSATPLRDGRILVVGGVDGRGTLSTVELYDPASGGFTAAASLPSPRATHGAVLLRDGRVLVAGGQAGMGHGAALVDTAAVYNPAANTWSDTGRLATPKYKLALAPLPGGGALVIGGQTADDPGARLATTELFDAASGRFTPGRLWLSRATRSPTRWSPSATAFLINPG